MKNRKTVILEKVKESCSSVLPIALTVIILSLTICPLPNDIFMAFIIGSCLLVVGLGLFSLGAEMSMSKIGSHIGSNLTKSRKIPIIAVISLIVGILITVSEPDLHVLAGYTPIKMQFIVAVAVGLGVMLVIAVLRIIFNVKIKYILAVGYGVILLLSFFVKDDILAIAYDAGGVTTGAMSVPFVMSIGAGIAAMSDQKSGEDSTFGLMAICSIGPIISVLTMGLMGINGIEYGGGHSLPSFDTSREMGLSFLSAIPKYMGDVLMGLLPILIFFLIFQRFTEKVHKNEMFKIGVGAIYTFVGVVLFLVGANVGFMPVGSYVGEAIAQSNISWIIIPIGMLLGFFTIYAEPAVGVLEKQVEDATQGSIPKKLLPLMMAIGVAVSAGIAMLRSLTGVPLLPFLVVGYAVAIILTFFTPSIFTSLAFDGGGVASGVMTATFLLPLAIGVCTATGADGSDIMTNAFGTIALVAMTPTISIQIMGIIYKHRADVVSDTDLEAQIVLDDSLGIVELENTATTPVATDVEIIEFDVERYL